MAIIIKQIRVLVCPCHDVVVMEVRFCVRVFALSVISFLSFFLTHSVKHLVCPTVYVEFLYVCRREISSSRT